MFPWGLGRATLASAQQPVDRTRKPHVEGIPIGREQGGITPCTRAAFQPAHCLLPCPGLCWDGHHPISIPTWGLPSWPDLGLWLPDSCHCPFPIPLHVAGGWGMGMVGNWGHHVTLMGPMVFTVNSTKHIREVYPEKCGCDWLSCLRKEESNSAQQQVLLLFCALAWSLM